MADIAVSIELEEIPSKGQAMQRFKMEMDPETSVQDLFDYLMEEGKVPIPLSEFQVYNNNTIISWHLSIKDLQKNHQTVELKAKVKTAPPLNSYSKPSGNASYIAPGPAKRQEEDYRNTWMHSPDTAKPESKPKPEPPSNYFKKQTQESDDSKFQIPPRILSDNAQKERFIPNPSPSTTTNTNTNSFLSKQKNQDIEFKIEFKESDYIREFQYSSKKKNEIEEGSSVLNHNGNLQVFIVDGNRKLKFEVERL